MSLADAVRQLPAADHLDAIAHLWSAAEDEQQQLAVLRASAELTGAPAGWYQTDPTGYIDSVLGGHMWSAQRRVADALVQHRRVAVPAGHDLGKSWLAGRLVCWWIETHPLGEAVVLSTAPTFNQVKGILWKEIARGHAEGQCRGELNQTEWYVTTELGTRERVAQGRKPADNSPGAFQGVHERFVLVVIDEADEVHPSIWEAVETVVTNEHSRVLAIGNPVWPTSEFAKVCAKRGAAPDWSGGYTDRGWWLERLNGMDSPNFTGEPIPDKLADLLLSPAWVEQYAAKHGEGSMAFGSRVLGQHPTESADGVVPLAWLHDRCQHMTEPAEGDAVQKLTPIPPADLWPPEELTPWELGVDVGAGGDRTVVTCRAGRRAVMWWETVSRDPRDTEHVIAEAVQWVADQGAAVSAIKIDVIGWGWGIYGTLLKWSDEGHLPQHCEVVPVHVGQASTDPTRYKNLRAQLWWEVGRELAEQGVIDLSDLPEEQILELAEPRYSTDASGRIVIEPKADTRSRIGASPDYADSWLLAYVTLPPEVGGYLLVDAHEEI